MVGSDYATCTAVPNTSPQHYDCWGDVFPYPLQQLQSYEVGGLRLIGLDTTMLDAAGGTMDAAQLGALSDVLQQDPDRPTLLFGHHPVTYESAATTEAGPAFDIDRPTAIALQRLYGQTPGVFFHHSGHTHRNKRTFLLDQDQAPIPSVEFLEVGATKEYPRRILAAAPVHRRPTWSALQEPDGFGPGLGSAHPPRVLHALPALHARHHRRPEPHGHGRPERPEPAQAIGVAVRATEANPSLG
jgi:hypothetical protein